ncbi:PREDICTED: PLASMODESMATA CALLOSE-BINDING PROTEIN 3 [Tarenaya hassleriana]|uniref:PLASMODESMATA CALLOSE-BINDING PROTEIN 3 n=1 Tax=Tarenaya hassleriana TaxID=28532 RepID=UPI00053C3A62|nr:PREDICTED: PLASMODESMATA CALLOSE-BINDING PROTEIN 3 [Tarenaya hassleriana]
MALPFTSISLLSLLLLVHVSNHHHRTAAYAMWCVARIDATSQALQSALDYACATGADCAPIQPTGLCYLPNTIQAHSSYAFNSYFQRRSMAPGSCYFAGTATLAKTDPSYGSCVYPSSLSTAGGTPATTTTFGGTPTTTITGNNPTTTLTPPTTTSPVGNGLTPPGTTAPPFTPSTSTTDESEASSNICMRTRVTLLCSVLMAVILF